MNHETTVTKKMLPEFQEKNPNVRVFRNNTGMAMRDGIPVYFGIGIPKVKRIPGSMRSITRQVGGGDFIGWETIEITPEMVGQKVAVFMSLEMKTKDGSLQKDQKDWCEMVENAGGIVVILRDE